MARKVNIIGAMWILSVAALGAWIGFMLTDTVLPTEYEQRGAIIVPDPAEDGGRVTVKINVKRNRSCPGTVARTLRDEATGKVVAIYDPVPAAFGSGLGDGVAAKTFELPEGLPPLVRYQADVCYQCNALQMLRPICTKAPDIVFGVKPRS